MKENNSISKEIARVTLTVSSVTVIVALTVLAFVFYAVHDMGYALISAVCTGLIALILLSLILPVKTADRIGKKINSISLDTPYTAEVYPELEEFRQKAVKLRKEAAKKLDEMELLHSEQDKLRRDFTANVSHELKTPLTSIKGYSELIRDGMVKSEDIPRFAGKIYDESHRLITLVGDIIKLSQLDGNDIEVKIEEIDLHELTLAVIAQLEMAADSKNVTVTLSGDKPVIKGGEQIVEEMIFNIIDNAIKYNRDGGSVAVKLRQRVDGVELEVSDTGIGIDEKNIPHIFERFWRADKSHSKEIGGTGLGLSIVKHGAMFMDAHVSVKSKINEGTTIRVLF